MYVFHPPCSPLGLSAMDVTYAKLEKKSFSTKKIIGFFRFDRQKKIIGLPVCEHR
jgi:hypothetical protein